MGLAKAKRYSMSKKVHQKTTVVKTTRELREKASQKLVDRLGESSDWDKPTEPFPLGVLQIQKINVMRPRPKIPDKLVNVTHGTYNTIYKTGDDKFAYRITSDPFKTTSPEVDELIREALLTIRLADLKVTPTIHDCYFAQTEKANGFNTHFVMVTEFSKEGSLDDYLENGQKGPTGPNSITSLVEQTGKLYKKMVKNYVFCTDVKPQNMLVTDDGKVKIIDFDGDFCASKESKFSGSFILQSGKTMARLMYSRMGKTIQPGGTKEHVLNGFWKLNLLQVAMISYGKACTRLDDSDKRRQAYAKQLVNTFITPGDLHDVILCSAIRVSKSWNGYKMFRHYFAESWPAYSVYNVVFNDDPTTMLTLAYLVVCHGPKEAFRRLHENNLASFNKFCKGLKTNRKPRMLFTKKGRIIYETWNTTRKVFTQSIVPPKGWRPRLEVRVAG